MQLNVLFRLTFPMLFYINKVEGLSGPLCSFWAGMNGMGRVQAGGVGLVSPLAGDGSRAWWYFIIADLLCSALMWT